MVSGSFTAKIRLSRAIDREDTRHGKRRVGDADDNGLPLGPSRNTPDIPGPARGAAPFEVAQNRRIVRVCPAAAVPNRYAWRRLYL